MSIPAALLASSDVSAGARLLAVAIAAHSDAESVCRVRYATLGAAIGASERIVRRRVAELVGSGWLARARTTIGVMALRPGPRWVPPTAEWPQHAQRSEVRATDRPAVGGTPHRPPSGHPTDRPADTPPTAQRTESGPPMGGYGGATNSTPTSTDDAAGRAPVQPPTRSGDQSGQEGSPGGLQHGSNGRTKRVENDQRRNDGQREEDPTSRGMGGRGDHGGRGLGDAHRSPHEGRPAGDEGRHQLGSDVRNGPRDHAGGSDRAGAPSGSEVPPGGVAQRLKPKRRRAAWSITDQERAAMREVLSALWEAMGNAEMGARAKRVPSVSKTNVGPHRSCPGFLGRWRELVVEGEDATALMVSVVRTKVQDQAERTGRTKRDQAAREGVYARSESLTRDAYWSANLAMARAALAGPALVTTKPKVSYGAVAQMLEEL